MQKTNQTEFRVQKVIKGKGDKLYINWESCDNSFSSLISKKKQQHNINEGIFSSTIWDFQWKYKGWIRSI